MMSKGFCKFSTSETKSPKRLPAEGVGLVVEYTTSSLEGMQITFRYPERTFDRHCDPRFYRRLEFLFVAGRYFARRDFVAVAGIG